MSPVKWVTHKWATYEDTYEAFYDEYDDFSLYRRIPDKILEQEVEQQILSLDTSLFDLLEKEKKELKEIAAFHRPRKEAVPPESVWVYLDDPSWDSTDKPYLPEGKTWNVLKNDPGIECFRGLVPRQYLSDRDHEYWRCAYPKGEPRIYLEVVG